MMRVEYRVEWKETWAKKGMEFNNLEEAIKWAKMKRNMGYEEVIILKKEVTEIEF